MVDGFDCLSSHSKLEKGVLGRLFLGWFSWVLALHFDSNLEFGKTIRGTILNFLECVRHF